MLGDTFTTGTPDCGSGSYVAASLVFSTVTGDGSFKCQFLDDVGVGPSNGTHRQHHHLRRYGDTDSGTGSQAVTVNNVAPTVVITGPTNVNESQTLRNYAFDTTDVGTLDTFTAGTPDCGSGVFVGPIVFSTVTGDGNFDCRFADDNPTGTASDLTAVSITITDDDTGAGTGTLNVTVNNVAPTVVITGPTNVNESQTLRNYAFDTTDVGTLDTFTAGTPDCGSGVFVGPSSSAPSPATATSTAASPMTTRPAPPRI